MFSGNGTFWQKKSFFTFQEMETPKWEWNPALLGPSSKNKKNPPRKKIPNTSGNGTF